MVSEVHGSVRDLFEFTDADRALARIKDIYATGANAVQEAFNRFGQGQQSSPVRAYYPYLGIEVPPEKLHVESTLSFGAPRDPGVYGTTLTRPDLFEQYYREQIELLLKNHDVPVVVGVSDRPIPLPFLVETATDSIGPNDIRPMQLIFDMPDLARTDDDIANGVHYGANASPGPKPLSLFSGERVDYSLARLRHYTATAPEHFQKFVLFTNYQRYVDEFIEFAKAQLDDPKSPYVAFVEPGPKVSVRKNAPKGWGESGEAVKQLPQMPSYHLVREDGLGVTLVNIGVGPSNAKTATDHIAVLRPHCWLMLGHCAGLRRSQLLGDYVLAHGYVRDDHVLDSDLPLWIPVPPIAEVQVALADSVTKITGLKGREMKARMRTGTVATTDNRNWELRYSELFVRLNQSRAIAVDMESATIAANGFRFRVPYGTLLCVSDKPVHGELKLPGMANNFYRQRIGQHLQVGLDTIDTLRQDVNQLHSRKLRSLDEPAFR